MALYIIESGDSVREAEKKMARNKTKTNKDRKYEPIYRDIETSFRDFFGTKVKLDAGKRKGKIIIEYSNNDDLECPSVSFPSSANWITLSSKFKILTLLAILLLAFPKISATFCCVKPTKKEIWWRSSRRAC